jgi:iron complex outermembrane receptor protein
MNSYALRLILIFGWWYIAPALLFSQQINGLIKDTADKPLEGITIQVKGTSKVATSDAAGKFEITAQQGDTLQVFVGYSDFEFVVGSNPNPEIILFQPNKTENPAIQIGYGLVRQSDLGGAVTHLGTADFTQGHVYHPYQLIRGRAAGLTLSRPGSNPLGNFDANQRGVHTMLGDNQPLVVIDGFPGASLQSIDPQDIAAIDVLRESSLAAIYGARAANGVIMIRTKNAGQNDTQVSYSGYVAAEQITRYPRILSAQEYRNALQDFSNLIFDPAQLDLGSATDWPREITRSPFSHAHQLAFSQGSGNSGYRLSLNYRRTEGITPHNYFEQWNGWLHLRHNAWKNRLQLQAQLGYTQRPYQDVVGDIMRYAASFNPTAPIFDASRPEFGGYYQTLTFESYNPVAMLEQIRRRGKQQVGTLNAQASLLLAKGLTWTGRLGFQQTNAGTNTIVSAQSFYVGYTTKGRADRTYDETANQLAETTLQYEGQLNNHGFTAMAGYAYQKFANQGLAVQGYDFIWDINQNFFNQGYNWGVEPDDRRSDLRDFRRESALVAFFGRAAYNWKRAVFATITYRREGSTRFGANNKWGNFYGANLSVELNHFLQSKRLEYLRLRTGYGLSGSLPATGVRSARLYEPFIPFYYDGRFVQSYGPASAPNPDLQWESRRETNAGIDVAISGGKLALSLDYYTNHAEDLIFETNDFTSWYFNRKFVNQYAIRNRGIELNMQATLLSKKNLRWRISGNLARNKAVYTDLGNINGSPQFANTGILFGSFGATELYLEEGMPVGNFHTLVFKGVNNGLWEYEDVNRDGGSCECYEDYASAGTGLPKATIGIGADVQWKRWNLSLFFRGVSGHSLVNVHRIETGVPAQLQLNMNVHEEAVKQPASGLVTVSNFSDFYVDNASFWQLDNLVLSYEWPKTTKLPLRIYFAGQQLFTLTKYSGIDPEVRLKNNLEGTYNPIQGVPYVPGFETRGVHYPTRTFVLGVQVGM